MVSSFKLIIDCRYYNKYGGSEHYKINARLLKCSGLNNQNSKEYYPPETWSFDHNLDSVAGIHKGISKRC